MNAPCTQCAAEATAQCAICRAGLCADHTITGQPLITASQLITTILRTAIHAPSMLGEILLKELDQVSYCSSCRETVAERRQAEQLKVAGGLFVALLLIVGLPLFLYFL